MTLKELIKIKREQGPEASNKIIASMTEDQRRALLTEACVLNLSLLGEFTLEAVDCIVRADLEIAQDSKKQAIELITKVGKAT